MIHAEYVEFDQPTGARVRRLEVFGHAGYAPRGQDIVCAGASMLMETLVYVLADCDEAECCAYNEPTGPRVSVKLTGSIFPTDLTAMEFAKTGLALLAERYPENIHYEDKSKDGQEKMVNLQLFAEGCGDGGAAAAAASGVDRTAGDGDAAAAVDAVVAVAAVGSDRTAGDGEAAAAVDAVCAAAALGRQAVIFAAGDGETAAAVDAAAGAVALQRVVAIQLNRGIAAAGHAYGGFVPAAGVDVHILECDLHLIVPGVDGHGVGRSGVLVLICDDGVGVAVGGIVVLGDVVAGVARFHGDVTILDVPCPCKSRGGKGGEHCGGQNKRCCPLRGRTG